MLRHLKDNGWDGYLRIYNWFHSPGLDNSTGNSTARLTDQDAARIMQGLLLTSSPMCNGKEPKEARRPAPHNHNRRFDVALLYQNDKRGFSHYCIRCSHTQHRSSATCGDKHAKSHPCISLPQSSGRELPSYFRRQNAGNLKSI